MAELNEKEIQKIIKDLKYAGENDLMNNYDIDIDFFDPLMDAFGDEEEVVKEYIRNMTDEDRDEIAGCRENIYGKFMNEDMWEFLDIFEQYFKH